MCVMPHAFKTTSQMRGQMEGKHTNMFGVKFVMWFDLSIEAKSTMDREEEDWGGIIEFGFSAKLFSKDIGDYFLLMEDECSTH